MISQAVKRFARAKQHVEQTLVNPVTELLEATTAVVAEARFERDEAKRLLEQMRPVWAQGFSTDSEAAQAATNAMSEMWAILGVDNQTAAMERLRRLTGKER